MNLINNYFFIKFLYFLLILIYLYDYISLNLERMLKPKTHIFILKFHLTKIEAINNKVNSKVHAYLFIGIKTINFIDN